MRLSALVAFLGDQPADLFPKREVEEREIEERDVQPDATPPLNAAASGPAGSPV